MKREKKTIICSIILIVITGIVYQFYQRQGTVQEDVVLSEMASPSEMEEQGDVRTSSKPEQEIRKCCYVCGAVKKPGVYDFTDGARLETVIELAGGFTEDAAENYLNLSEAVEDSEKIYVPTSKEAASQQLNDNVEIPVGTECTGDKVNVNTADIDTLTTLPGIGEAKANSILSYREEHGKFQSIEELKDIEGIKDGVFSKIKDLITVQ